MCNIIWHGSKNVNFKLNVHAYDVYSQLELIMPFASWDF